MDSCVGYMVIIAIATGVMAFGAGYMGGFTRAIIRYVPESKRNAD